MVTLVEVLYGATVFETFCEVCGARYRTNPRQFVSAISLALLHRLYCSGVILPSAYEIIPHMFQDD
jgi:hypothetical protein